MEKTELPHDVLGHHDTLRLGLPALKSDVLPAHPVQSLHQERVRFGSEAKRKLLGNAYGSAFTLQQDFERQILSRFRRPDNMIPSSMLGLESLTGTLDELSFDDLLYDQRDSARFIPADMHCEMERRLGLSKNSVPRAM